MSELKDKLKTTLETATLAPEERAEWLELLPKMSEGDAARLLEIITKEQKVLADLEKLTISPLWSQLKSSTVVAPRYRLLKPDDFYSFGYEALRSAQTKNEILLTISDVEKWQEAAAAREYAQAIKSVLDKFSNLETDEPEFYKTLKEKYVLLNFSALSLLPDQEKEKLFKENLLTVLRQNIDVENVIARDFIVYNDDITPQGRERLLLTNALRANREQIGDLAVAGWLQNYDRTFGLNKERKSIDRVSFVNKNEQAKSLIESENNLLLKVLQLYDFLKFEPVISSGYREAYSISEKKPVAIVKPKPSVERPESRKPTPTTLGIIKPKEVTSEAKLSQSYQAWLQGEFYKEVEKETREVESRLERDTLQGKVGELRTRAPIKSGHGAGQDTENSKVPQGSAEVQHNSAVMKTLRSEFYKSVNEKKAARAVAALKIMFERGLVRAAFAEDERFVKFWGKHLEQVTRNPEPEQAQSRAGKVQGYQQDTKGSAWFSDTDQRDVPRGSAAIVDEFKRDPGSAKYLAMFFRYILEKRLGLSEQDSAKVGVMLGSLAREKGEKEYSKIAYGDLKTSEFKWNIKG